MTDQPQPTGSAPAQDEDIQQRVEAFNKEVLPLLGKYELGLAAEAFIMNGQILARPTVLSVRGRTDLQPNAPAPTGGLAKPE